MCLIPLGCDASLALVSIVAWGFLLLVSRLVARRGGISPQSLSPSLRAAAIGMYALAVGVGLITSSLVEFAQATFGVLVLFIGWAISYERLWGKTVARIRGSHQAPLGSLLAKLMNSAVGSRPHVSYEVLAGDMIQVVGFSVLAGSWFALITVIGCQWVIEWAGRQVKDVGSMPPFPGRRPYGPPMLVWPGWAFLGRVAAAGGVAFALAAIASGEWAPFSGGPEDAVNLTSALLQVETTIGALVFAILFVLLEVTGSTYGGRLSELVWRSSRVGFTLLIVILSILTKVGLLANSDLLSGYGLLGVGVDVMLLLTAATVLSYVGFGSRVLAMLSPERLAAKVLLGFNEEWMEEVRREWSGVWGPRYLYGGRDPLVLLERILMASLEKGDLNSYVTCLAIARERIGQVRRADDGAALDNYFVDRFDPVLGEAGARRAEQALLHMLESLEGLTTPSEAASGQRDGYPSAQPPGEKFVRRILRGALEEGLEEVCHGALRAEKQRLERSFAKTAEELRRLSGMKLSAEGGPERQDANGIGEAHYVGSRFSDGYIHFLGDVATRAIRRGLPSVASHVCSILVDLVGWIIGGLEDHDEQRSLVRMCLFRLQLAVKEACARKLAGAVDIAGYGMALEKIRDADLAKEIAKFLGDGVVEMAKAGILGYSTLVDVAVHGTDLVWEYPEVSLELIRAYGEAGKRLRRLDEESGNDDLRFVRQELASRLSQLAGPARTGALREEMDDARRQALVDMGVEESDIED